MQKESLLHRLFIQENNRFLLLLSSLVLFFASYPIMDSFIIVKHLLNLLFILIVFSSIIAISDSKHPLIISLSLASLLFIFRTLHYLNPINFWFILELCCNTFFWAYTATNILKFILKQSIVTAELIYAAIAVYFIIGLSWTSAYQVIEISNSGSFSFAHATNSKQGLFFQMWYFSMVTLTTLGYGDITPINMLARSFVILEAIVGQFYLAILIASLIGQRIAQKSN
ncbi:MAG: potassium channel family protein [Methyloprofundus sp.]|nr:potassium channel family protein [Methyloprofundus sp.]